MTLLTGRLLLIVVAETEKMGQVQSEAATVDQQGHWGSSAVPSASPSFSSMDSLIAGTSLSLSLSRSDLCKFVCCTAFLVTVSSFELFDDVIIIFDF